MKKEFALFVLAGLLAMAMGFAACSSDEDETLPPEDNGAGDVVDSIVS